MLYINVLNANVRKVVLELLRYMPNTVSLVVTFYAIFLMFFFGIKVIASPENQAGNLQYTVVSTILWFLAITVMQGIGWEITTEATRGTLEQLYMSPVSAWRILVARTVGSILVYMVAMIIVLIAAMWTSGQWLHIDLLTLLPLFALLLFAMTGISLMIAGLAIILKQVQAFLQIIQFAFFGLVAVPVTMSPFLDLLPVVRGSSMIRDAMTKGMGLFEFSGLDWGMFTANSVVYFVLGVFLYKLAEQRAMNQGLLGQY